MNTFIKNILTCLLLIVGHSQAENYYTTHKLPQSADADWVIVGAGPAGIAMVGVLLDVGVNPYRITWIDPEFNVGRLGPYYGKVPANNKTGEFIYFINACAAFQECTDPEVEYLRNTDPNNFNTLDIVIKPLVCITQHLRTKVNTLQDSLNGLYFEDDLWHVDTKNNKSFSAQHVVLATGSHPRTLDYAQEKIIPLDIALNPENLATILKPSDTVGVFGSSHSGILLLKFLSEISVKHIYNFYRNPLIYAVDMGGWTLNANTGLKGATAQWAKEVLENNPPHNLTRIQSDDTHLQKVLPECNKVIYAIGFERNELPWANNTTLANYNAQTGIIAPRLFGAGIAFPEETVNPIGQTQQCVGLDCFMDYALKLIPTWIEDDTFKKAYAKERALKQRDIFKKVQNLFTIVAL